MFPQLGDHHGSFQAVFVLRRIELLIQNLEALRLSNASFHPLSEVNDFILMLAQPSCKARGSCLLRQDEGISRDFLLASPLASTNPFISGQGGNPGEVSSNPLISSKQTKSSWLGKKG